MVAHNYSNGLNSLPLESNNTLTLDLNASVNLEMIWVEPGTFMMGQVGVAEPVHEVTLTEGFYLGKFEGNAGSVRGGDDG